MAAQCSCSTALVSAMCSGDPPGWFQWETHVIRSTVYGGRGIAVSLDRHWAGFGARHQSDGRTTYRVVAGPLWVLEVALLVPPALWLRRLIRTRGRLGTGHCAACGYDLRATPERCPECGTLSAAHETTVAG